MGVSRSSGESPATLVDVLRGHAVNRAGSLAVTFLKDGEVVAQRLSYGELDRKARALAQRLRQAAAPGDRALMLFESNVEFVVAFLGCLYANVVAVPAYPPRSNHHLSRLAALVEDCRAVVVLSTAAIHQSWAEVAAQRLPQLAAARWLVVGDAAASPEEEVAEEALAAAWRRPEIDEQSLAFLQYTSGSTGAPKGVMVSHGNLLHNERMVEAAFGHTETSTLVGWLPLFHDMGLIGNVLQPLYLGNASVLMSPTAFIQRPVRWLWAISRHGGDDVTSGAPNFAYELCARQVSDKDLEGVDLSGWRLAYNGAEPIRADVLDAFADRFAPYGFRRSSLYPCYGMAEATLFVSGNPRATEPVFASVDAAALEEGRVVKRAAGERGARRLVSCGRTWLEQDAQIVEPSSLVASAAGRVGEIWLSSGSVAQGYWQRPELSQEVFQARLGGRPYLRTGDLGFLDGDQLYVTGRIKDLVIIRGRNHYPQDIEATVAAVSPVLRPDGGAAFAAAGQRGEELVIVQEVARVHRSSIDAEALVGQIRQAVSEAHELMVRAVVLIDQAHLPKTSSGKIQRSACRQAFLAGSFKVLHQWTAPEELDEPDQGSATGAAAPPGPEWGEGTSAEVVRDWLVARMAARLQVPAAQIDPREPVAHYGLDSALAVSLVDELGKKLGQELEPLLFWEHPSIEQLAAHLASLAGPAGR
jgi:acyl-CoA synthetase (AMP-forming)/AMP-acid ligase II/acyl carrier protein